MRRHAEDGTGVLEMTDGHSTYELDLRSQVGIKYHSRTRNLEVLPGEHPVDAASRARQKETRVRELNSVNEINQMVDYFLTRGKFRDACLFVMGCNTALRISDLLCLRWKDVLEGDEVELVEKKTRKIKHTFLNEAIRHAVSLYMASLDSPVCMDDYLFVSQAPHKKYAKSKSQKEGGALAERVRVQPMDQRSAARIIRNAAKELGLYTDQRRISTHSMRKTALNAVAGFIDGYELPDQVGRLVIGTQVAQLLGNHSGASTTSNYYLDLQTKVMQGACQSMNLGLTALETYEKEHDLCLYC